MAVAQAGSGWVAPKSVVCLFRMPLPVNTHRPAWNIRLVIVCMTALSVALPIAWISLSKVLLVLAALGSVALGLRHPHSGTALSRLQTPKVVLAVLLLFSLSLIWTDANLNVALAALVKHGKLLTIVLLVFLIRSRQEARLALMVFAFGQALLLCMSWLLALGVPNPWIPTSAAKYVVFSSYLDQSIIFASAAAVWWHLRHDLMWPRWVGSFFAAAALINTLLLLPGRTGYAVAAALVSLAVMWAVPKRLRLVALALTPAILLLGLYIGSATVQERLARVVDEGQHYGSQALTESSSGWRLNAWKRSLQAIQENPLAGHGIGSWTQTIKRLEGPAAESVFGKGNASNPHQEYLLWGVELGVGGIIALLLLMGSIGRDAMNFNTSICRATLSVLVAMAVACLFNSTLYDGLIGDFFCTSLGLLLALGARQAALDLRPDGTTRIAS